VCGYLAIAGVFGAWSREKKQLVSENSGPFAAEVCYGKLGMMVAGGN
jgi:hypothetical protein